MFKFAKSPRPSQLSETEVRSSSNEKRLFVMRMLMSHELMTSFAQYASRVADELAVEFSPSS